MNIKTFKGFGDIYPEKVEGTDAWYYGQWTPCSEASEVLDFDNRYPGTKLYLIKYPSGEVFEPIAQQKNVFLEAPVYEYDSDTFGIIRYDFNEKIIQVLAFQAERSELKILTELPFAKASDLNNLRLVTSPFALVKYDIENDMLDYLWPQKRHIQCEECEWLDFQYDGKLYMTRWIEDPDYREEIIIRDATTGEIIDRSYGYLRRMPDGSVWKMTR